MCLCVPNAIRRALAAAGNVVVKARRHGACRQTVDKFFRFCFLATGFVWPVPERKEVQRSKSNVGHILETCNHVGGRRGIVSRLSRITMTTLDVEPSQEQARSYL